MKRIYSRFKKSKTYEYDPDELVDYEEDHVLTYTEKGQIQRPSPTVTMSMIRTVMLEQHCQIKPSELTWFEEGLKWLAQQQYQNANEYKYVIQEDAYYNDEKKRNLQFDIEDLERACEAYFGIPLHLCENHWAAEYLMVQATKGNVLRRMKFKSNTSFTRFKFTLKKLFFGCLS